MSRSDWRQFLATVSMGDLKMAFQYFAKKGGRKQASFRPSCLDPLWVNEQWIVHSRQKVEALAHHFATKLSAGGKMATKGSNPVRIAIRRMYRGGTWELQPPISPEEVHLAAQDLPTNRAPGPDEIPAEMFKKLPALREALPGLFTNAIEKIKFRQRRHGTIFYRSTSRERAHGSAVTNDQFPYSKHS